MSRLEDLEARLNNNPGADLVAVRAEDLRNVLALAKAVQEYEQASEALSNTRGGDDWETLKARQSVVNDKRWRMFRALAALEKGPTDEEAAG